FVLVLVAGQADLGCPQQLAPLGGDGVEYLSGRGSLGNERRDPAQRGLLFREFASPRFRGGELGTALGVRDRRRRELGELLETLLGVGREEFVHVGYRHKAP